MILTKTKSDIIHLLLFLKLKIYLIFNFLTIRRNKINKNGIQSPRCFVFLAADYGNLGDVAITYAQEKFLHLQFPHYEIVDCPISQTLKSIVEVKKIVQPQDIITTVGGGNMGEMYYDIELLRLLVIKSFPNNRIISFPQTCDYPLNSKSFLCRFAKKVYNRHQNLLLCAREEKSFQVMTSLFEKAKVILVPDIVMSLNEMAPPEKRSGILLCLRKDKELGKFSNAREFFEKEFSKNRISYSMQDTHIGNVRLSIQERKSELDQIWDKFRRAEWVITDRLHGMIFAFITGTPAIVLPNSNFKVQEAYKWIKDCEYIFIEQNSLIYAKQLLNKNTNTISFDKCSTKLQQSMFNIIK